jgi:O-antigen ligase
LNFDDSWGTRRGQNWKYSVSIYVNEFSPIQKLIGIGPDCYKPYELEYHSEYAALWVSPIANAHNEFLTSMISSGILGTISYYGFLISCCVLALRGRKKAPILLLFPAAAVCICFNNLFSFMTCVSTPILFLLMGWLRGIQADVSAQH